MQKCMYCGKEISDDSVLAVCHRCGEKVWGEKMFKTIVKNMEDAKNKGDLCHMNDNFNFSKKLETA